MGSAARKRGGMKVEYLDGKICVDIGAILDALTLEEKQEIIEALACQDDIIKHVADQIIEGYTERSFHGCTGGGEDFSTPLDNARYQVAMRSGESARYVIERLRSAAVFEHSVCDQYQDWAIRLQNILLEKGIPCPRSPNIQERKGYEIVLNESEVS